MSNPGTQAEARAAEFLVAKGLRIVERNYRCRYGEIDLIARDSGSLVFVEVRYRATRSFGEAGESITAAKRSRLLRAARHYLAAHPGSPQCRFDAVLLNGDTGSFEWIRDAFGE